MSRQELARFLDHIQNQYDVSERINQATDLAAAAEIAKELGFDVNWIDWLRYQATIANQLSNEEALKYCREISKYCESFAHGTFVPVFGYGAVEGGFSWVKPFISDAQKKT
jgi:predicted ribosomally synthesized peptide with nif11-like leader